MPSILVHPPGTVSRPSTTPNPLPQLLRTPSGLALLELQGTIHVPTISAAEQEAQSQDVFSQGISTPVGKLMFPFYSASNPPEDTSWMKGVYLYVGKHQRLTGEVKKLPKPMGIMRKRLKENAGDAEELEIVEIVRHKIVFSSRPEPVGDE